ncbi:MAG TPA: AzlC family ABC transporter permease [Solirubrobacteraceae bacterium]|nr:AzlC family ABC transporter permease [Solirubrobacteraceae bacterium]
MSATVSSPPGGTAAMVPSEPPPQRAEIIRAAAGIGVYAGAFGVTFGAVSATAGLSVIQAVTMSAVMFTGASQFALVGILAVGGAPLAGLSAALLLGLRNAFYGVPVTDILGPRGLRRLSTAHFVIDETTAMAVAQSTRRAGRYAFWATGVTLFALWNLGTLCGALIGSGIDTSALGLDAAAPAIFLALLWPQLSRDRAPAVALGAIVVALGLGSIAPAGVPIIATAAVAIAAGLLPARPGQKRGDG